MIRATLRGCRWCAEPGNHDELADLLATSDVVGVDADLIRPALAGDLAGRHILDFYRPTVENRPTADHAAALIAELVDAGQLDVQPDSTPAGLRPDLYDIATGSPVATAADGR